MGVKKHKLVADERNQLDLANLSQYFQLMNDQLYLPPTDELIEHCQDIVKCLARSAGTVDQLWKLVAPIEQFLFRVITSVHSDVKHEVITAILDKIYSYISEPQTGACPATSAVLIVLDEANEDAVLSISRWLVQRSTNENEGAGSRAALSCLYGWLHDWPDTPALGFWTLMLIKVLEENVCHDILIETSLDNLTRLLSRFITQKPINRNTANAIFHVLASLRDSVEAFDRIAPVVGKVLESLASESGQWSRQVLQDLVDILAAMIDRIVSSLKGDAQVTFIDKYGDVISCLERHMASRECTFLHQPPWCAVEESCPSINNNVLPRKVGLENLRNTCYMNSVVQALLLARQFSNHAMIKAHTVPYWEKIGELFACMTFSASNKLDPEKFLGYLRPSYFALGNQYDSYEFLGYLFQVLQSYEHSKETKHDYTKPPVFNGSRMRAIVPDEQSEATQRQRSASPRPCSSKGSSGVKRSCADFSFPRKRPRPAEPSLQSQSDTSVIDSQFGGVLLTRVQCTVCRASSLSRDTCRDLQLAFPEKEEGREHSVQSLLEYFCSKENLTGDNRYQCRDCGVLRDAERSVLIETTPNYLVLVLKNFNRSLMTEGRDRLLNQLVNQGSPCGAVLSLVEGTLGVMLKIFFRYDAKKKVETKLMHSVFYNQTVTLPTVRPQATLAAYTLFAAVIHHGSTLDSGHYYTLGNDGGQWYNFNDTLVTRVDESKINRLEKANTPYILLYRRSDVEESSAPAFEELPARIKEVITSINKKYFERKRKTRSRQ